jgi:hypothetical protein
MTDGRHYRVDFVTFSRILGFREEHRGYTYIHDEPIREISYMLRDSRIVDGKRSGLHSFYYILNNLIRKSLTQRMEQRQILMAV